MTLREWLINNELFEAINNIKPFPFIGDDASSLDTMLRAYHGDRQFYRPLQSLDAVGVAQLLVMNFSNTWNTYTQLTELTANPNTRREVTETINNDEARTTTSENLNKVSSFNDDSLLVNDGSDSSGLDELQGVQTRTLLDEQIDVKNSFELLSSSSKRSIVQLVLKDVSQFVTLSIY